MEVNERVEVVQSFTW